MRRLFVLVVALSTAFLTACQSEEELALSKYLTSKRPESLVI